MNQYNSECLHGQCRNHEPEWKIIGEKQLKPNPGVFGQKNYWTSYHCGSPMARYKEVQAWQCVKCGRKKTEAVIAFIALCLCCGYSFHDGSYD